MTEVIVLFCFFCCTMLYMYRNICSVLWNIAWSFPLALLLFSLPIDLNVCILDICIIILKLEPFSILFLCIDTVEFFFLQSLLLRYWWTKILPKIIIMNIWTIMSCIVFAVISFIAFADTRKIEKLSLIFGLPDRIYTTY